mgnify:CR=1
ARCEQHRSIVYGALHVIAATQWIAGIRKALLEIDHNERWPLTKSDIALAVASLCKFIHESWDPVVLSRRSRNMT